MQQNTEKKNSKIKLINDYRDAWIDGFFSWNKNLTSTDDIYQKQKEMELFSLNNCDAIVSVTPELLDKLKYKVKDKNIDCVLITNGFDKRDLDSSEYPYPVEFNKNDINICHFGTLDFGREDEFMKFISTNEISERIKFYLIGSLNVKLRETIVNFKNVIHIPYLQPALIKPYLYHADFHLAVNDVEFYYAYGSKIFDAMLYSKPFIFVSKENSLVEKYRENPYFLHTDNSAISNKKIFESIVSNKHLNVSKPDYSEFDLEHLTNKYYQLINMQLNKNATATI